MEKADARPNNSVTIALCSAENEANFYRTKSKVWRRFNRKNIFCKHNGWKITKENFCNISKIKIFTMHFEKRDNMTMPTALKMKPGEEEKRRKITQ